MRLPPWVTGALMALVVAVVWWTVSGRGGDEVTAPAPTPAAVATPDPGAGASDPADPDRPEPTGTDTRPWDGIDACEDHLLPATMIPVVEGIWAGGPHAYPDRDGGRFGNYEGYLPEADLGYYREFTVQTPGLHHRGARRIVTGGGTQGDPDVWYYTEDHYETFCEFAP